MKGRRKRRPRLLRAADRQLRAAFPLTPPNCRLQGDGAVGAERQTDRERHSRMAPTTWLARCGSPPWRPAPVLMVRAGPCRARARTGPALRGLYCYTRCRLITAFNSRVRRRVSVLHWPSRQPARRAGHETPGGEQRASSLRRRVRGRTGRGPREFEGERPARSRRCGRRSWSPAERCGAERRPSRTGVRSFREGGAGAL